MIRVLIVDDSATMRGLIRQVLSADSEIEVIGAAGDALEARSAIKTLNPDVLTLDVEMPNMNGLEFLEKIVRLRPMPVVMVSTLTHQGMETAIQAMEIGAVDCVGKPVPGDAAPFSELVAKVKAAARCRVRHRVDPTPPPSRAIYRGSRRILAIGSSTGGVEALITLIGALPANCPPTVITQHMPANFTRSFAARLDRLCAPRVEEATDGALLQQGVVYLAPGGERHLIVEGRTQLRCRLLEGEPVSGHRPSVDRLFDSVAQAAGAASVGVILTGMGRDGAHGLLAMRQAGASTFGQGEASCVVYGMPKAAMEIGAVEREAPLTALAALVLEACEVPERVH